MGNRLEQLGCITIPGQYSNRSYRDVSFYILDVEGPAILGLSDLKAFKIVMIHHTIDAAEPVKSTKDLVRNRIVMPKALQQDTLQRIHAGHQGSTKCKDRARTFWENINEDIDNMVRKCQICTECSSSQSAQPLQNHEIPT